MRRSGFKRPTLDQVKAKQAAKSRIRPVAKKKVAKRAKTQAQLKKELDTIFSLYIRQKFSDSNGNNRCYTCGKPGTIKTMQCGHFVSRQYLATRWDENNCRVQCVGCNVYGNGKPLDFEENLKRELGDDFVEKMKASRHQSLKLDRHWYEERIAYYKSMV